MSDLTNISTPDAETLAKADDYASDEHVALRINNLRDAIKCLYRDRRDPIIRDMEVRAEMALTAIGMNRQQLLARLAEAEKRYDDFRVMHDNTIKGVEEILKPEWEDASHEMVESNNSSWCGVVHIAVGMIREQLEKAQEDYADSQASLSKVQGERDAMAKVVEKLPKTADGVSIVPGMMLYIGATYAVAYGHVGQRAPIRSVDGMHHIVGEMFSTRDAALAASQGKETK